MKRILLLSLVCAFCIPVSFAQTVDNIRVEQSGDFIKISYNILDSRPSEIYRVKVLCSIDGGLNIELRSVTGDVGDQVIGGKAEYWVVWDVLKDMDEVGFTEFIVRAELIKDLTPVTRPKRAKIPVKTSILATGFLPGPGYGVRLSFTHKAGVSVVAVRGKAVVIPNEGNFNPEVNIHRVGMALVLRLAKNEKNQLHLLVGPALGEVLTDQSQSPEKNWAKRPAPGIEGGLILHLKSFSFSFSGVHLYQTLVEEEPAMSKITFLNAGIGFNF